MSGEKNKQVLFLLVIFLDTIKTGKCFVFAKEEETGLISVRKRIKVKSTIHFKYCFQDTYTD